MGLLKPGARPGPNQSLGTFGRRKAPMLRAILASGLACVSAALIGGSVWFALQLEQSGPAVIAERMDPEPAKVMQLSAVRETPAPEPDITPAVSDVTPVTLKTKPVKKTTESVKTPREETLEKARLALMNSAEDPLVILTLDEVEELKRSVAPDTSGDDTAPVIVVADASPAGDLLARPEIVPVGAQDAEPADAVPPRSADQASITVAAATAIEVKDQPDPVPAMPPCIRNVRDIATASVIYFDTSSAQFDANAMSLLRVIGSAVQNCPDVRVQVAGHSDSSGGDAANLNLSWQRADNAITALTVLGIDTSRFEPVGFGARAPASAGDNTDPDFDRRVEFVVLSDG